MATVALVGATGTLGSHLLPELITSDAIKVVHSLSRRAIPDGGAKVKNFQVDYKDPKSVEGALTGCDVLINTMGTEGDFHDSKHALIDAAAKVGVKYYIPSQFGVDVHVQSDAVNHDVWNSKKADDIAAQRKGLRVIAIFVGLFMEHPQAAFMPAHGFFPEEQTWYMPGTGDVPLTVTSKKDICRSIVEIIKIAMTNPSQLPQYVRIAGTNKTPREIVDIFNFAAKGKTNVKLKVLSDEEADRLIRGMKWEAPPDRESQYDLDYMKDVGSRVFRMSGGTGNIDFSKKNDNELVNPGESRWKWKTMEEYAKEVDGMPNGEW